MSKHLVLLFILIVLITACNTKEASEMVTKENSEVMPSENLKRNDYLAKLIEGNERYVSNLPKHPYESVERKHELTEGQNPFAVILTCSDSRCPPELIFDRGLGDLFVIRNAGNIIGDYELGSIEYAVEHLDVSLVVVLGHTNCGAVGAYLEHKHDSIPNHIQSIVDYIKNEKEQNIDSNITDYYNKAIQANVIHGLNLLQQSEPIIKEFVEAGKTKIVGAIYDLESGKVNFLE